MLKDDTVDNQLFDNYQMVDKKVWDNMLSMFEKFPDYDYRKIDYVTNVYGYNLCFTHLNGWQLYPIALDIKNNIYTIKNKEKTIVPDYHLLKQNNFIFCVNSVILEYIQKNTHILIQEMCKDLNFQITRLTISDRLDNQTIKK